MKPEDFRQLLLPPGAKLSLIGGDYGGAEWSYEERIKGVLKLYVVIERHHHATIAPKSDWDAAAIMMLPKPVAVTEDSVSYVGNELLLIQRYPNFPWDDEGQTVWVFGIQPGELVTDRPLARQVWQPKTVLLSYGATMLEEEAPSPSAMSRAFQRGCALKKLERQLDLGLVTVPEYEREKAQIAARFPY